MERLGEKYGRQVSQLDRQVPENWIPVSQFSIYDIIKAYEGFTAAHSGATCSHATHEN